MRFRLKAFALHLSSSAAVLALVLGALYLGWYRWPGWYVSGALQIAAMMLGVDAALGPLLTLIIANPTKPRGELARDIGIIVTVQIIALGYGTVTLWHGRPLYYAFSVNELQLVQASDLDDSEISLAQKENPQLAPYWYSRPRWVWAPLPEDDAARSKIVNSAVSGGTDIIQMPRYFKTWDEGLPELRKRLTTLDKVAGIDPFAKRRLMKRLPGLGVKEDVATMLALTGRGQPLLAVFDPQSLQIEELVSIPAHY
jgi:hypothetical protein